VAGSPDPAYEPLAEAFESLRLRNYDAAISDFRKAAALAPARSDIRKNLAYTLLKTGDSEAARLEFGEAMRIDPADTHVALEYAFLCYEARDDASAHKADARRIFARVRDTTGDAEMRATAAQVFTNVDAPLAAGIARWQTALASAPPTFSAHYELAQFAEQRDENELAATHYRAAFGLLRERKSVLLDLARVEKARGNPEGAMAAWVAASRSGEPRAAELAREQMPDRYPYVYEFRQALGLDPSSPQLHRELAYLLLRMSESDAALRTEAEREFAVSVKSRPGDWLSAAQLGLLYLEDKREDLAMPLLRDVLAHADPATAKRVRLALKMPLILEDRTTAAEPLDPRILGEHSYDAGFLKDALRYFGQAREANPLDARVALKLGWTHNMLHQDAEAVRWFDVARHSSDPAVADEAARAWKNLAPNFARFRTTFWICPLYSSRWSDVFGYGQIRTDMRTSVTWLRPYVSLRFVGDAAPGERLSESAFVMGTGVATRAWRHATGWFEAGTAFSYQNGQRWRDLRGGLSWSRTFTLHNSWFLESNLDSVFLSHFRNNLIQYSQNKLGYRFTHVQALWNAGIVFDANRQYWANYAETGPGVRFHLPGAPPAMNVMVSWLRGFYLVNAGNPRGPNFNDFRIGVWYAISK
jgi:tetratricopeptide (TPR) repeat protein